MSQLIDTLDLNNTMKVNGGWVVIKPSINLPFKRRVKDAYRVLTGKSRAYHYYQDSTKTYI